MRHPSFAWASMLLLAFLTTSSWAETPSCESDCDPPEYLKPLLTIPTYESPIVPLPEGLPSAADWRSAIDATWGEGLPTPQKLAIFDNFWFTIDREFAAYHGVDVDWLELKNRYRPEIERGVSRGRFAAIMSHLSLALRESHTRAFDMRVNSFTILHPGVPVLYLSDWLPQIHFGACLTPLPDESLLVYRVGPNHPLGLEPGDRVLGYEGVPWNELLPGLLEAELPLAGLWGSSPASFQHSLLGGAGMNWHLFHTIDIQKHATGEVVHLSTAVMDKIKPFVHCTEQIDVPGVRRPDYFRRNLVTWGIVEGTQVGYIYVYGWFWDARGEFLDAMRSLLVDRSTTGLIIDLRLNYGGDLFLSNAGLELLFDHKVTTVAQARRRFVDDHFTLYPDTNAGPSVFAIPGKAKSFYDHPIAVLTGPGAYSSGDQFALRMTYHPRARTFGKSTNGAFNRPVSTEMEVPEWFALFAKWNTFRADRPADYLTHQEMPVDFPVWLETDDVAQGRDTVVEKALRWINNRRPQAQLRQSEEVECTSSDGAEVTLDGSESSDPDSSHESYDDIVRYEWFEEFGTPAQKLLGTSELARITLPLGSHPITLRVTDSFGEVDTAAMDVRVADTTPPRLSLDPSPSVLWPPNHRMVDVFVAASAIDACSTSSVTLRSVTSTEPSADRRSASGAASGDIQGAEPGLADFVIRLRAERAGFEADRIYTLTYGARDGAGNEALGHAYVRVPHDASPGP
jgi:peptidase S41-like protein